MKEKILNAYQPPEHFQEAEKLPPVVEEAADDNTELWLIRIPANEIGPADLVEQKVKINPNVIDGIVGHFANSQGEDYNIVKRSKVGKMQPYAFIPNGADPLVVRTIACQVGFVKSLPVMKDSNENSHHRSKDGGVTENEPTTSGLTSEKEHGSLLGVEKPAKKKRRRSEASELK
ncbi:unnamed protein product [Calypogeia fissa]